MQKNLYGMLKMAEIRKKAYDEGTPIQATFELTPRCGFNCRMCYVHLPVHKIPEVGDGRELTGEEWLEIGRQAAEMGVLSLCITGGDPVCHPDFKEIWAGLAQMGFRMTLQTNASQLTDEILELLEEYPPELVKITLYGSNDEVCREVCRVEGGFTRADAGIQALREREIPIQLVTTFIRQNEEDAQNIAEYAKRNNLPWYYSAACYPSLRGADSEARECGLEFVAQECAEEISELWNNLPLMKDDRPGKRCGGYRTHFSISWDGNMRFCLFLNEPNIRVTEKELNICWSELLDYWGSLRWPEECGSCEYKEKCIRCIAHIVCLNGGGYRVEESYCKKIKQMLNIMKEKG